MYLLLDLSAFDFRLVVEISIVTQRKPVQSKTVSCEPCECYVQYPTVYHTHSFMLYYAETGRVSLVHLAGGYCLKTAKCCNFAHFQRDHPVFFFCQQMYKLSKLQLRLNVVCVTL